tara:strand:+ start:4671 stop:4856 length:186 start_codon:yes stop_codon:yes gene_type:complete
MLKQKWVTVRLLADEIKEIDQAREKLIKSIGISVSRSAFLRGLILNNLNRDNGGSCKNKKC